MGDAVNIAHLVEKMGEGMKIHMSGTSKHLLDKVGGFRCEYRGILDMGVRRLFAIPRRPKQCCFIDKLGLLIVISPLRCRQSRGKWRPSG